ncbi:MAG: apolipoprotein N-acyltransferase, partial [Pseudomonadota bacterium]
MQISTALEAMNPETAKVNYAQYIKDALALFSGAITPLSFAPMNFWWLAFVTPGLLFYCLQATSYKRAFWRGYLFGLANFLVGVSWVYVSIHVFGNVNVFIAGTITLLFVAVLALYPGIMCYAFQRLFKRSKLVVAVLGFAVIWALFAWLRSSLFSGFPWNLLAYSQVDSPLAGFIPLLGSYGLIFLLVLMSSGLVIFIQAIFKKQILPLVIVPLAWAIILFSGFALGQIAWTQAKPTALSVALMQGNIPQSIKWDPKRAISIIKTYVNITSDYWQKNVIVWPEAAIPIP